MNFSKRNGIEPPKQIQNKSMGEDLRNSLWNVFFKPDIYDDDIGNIYEIRNNVVYQIWTGFLKNPVDEFSGSFYNNHTFVKNIFLQDTWDKVYELLEFIAKKLRYNEIFIDKCNKILEQEYASYRFVDDLITPITNEIEIEEIEGAIHSDNQQIHEHIKLAVTHLSNKNNPDYRNSIKEAISAVEHICRKVTNESTLDGALKKLKNNNLLLNNQFIEGIEKLYHYTNGKEDIRHSLMNESNVEFEEAKFMLVICSAFCNYIIGKISKLEEPLNK